jgi:hypothetical protein
MAGGAGHTVNGPSSNEVRGDDVNLVATRGHVNQLQRYGRDASPVRR